MPLTQVTDHAAVAVANLLQQFSGKPALEALVALLAEPATEIEGVLFDMQNKRIVIDDAEGVQLAGIGNLLGVPRAGDTDADYRARIRMEIAAHIADGTGDSIIETASTGFGYPAGQHHIALREPANALGEFEAYERTPDTGALLEGNLDEDQAAIVWRLLNLSRAGGFYFVFLWGDQETTLAKPAFAFDTAGSSFDATDAFRIRTKSAAFTAGPQLTSSLFIGF